MDFVLEIHIMISRPKMNTPSSLGPFFLQPSFPSVSTIAHLPERLPVLGSLILLILHQWPRSLPVPRLISPLTSAALDTAEHLSLLCLLLQAFSQGDVLLRKQKRRLQGEGTKGRKSVHFRVRNHGLNFKGKIRYG